MVNLVVDTPEDAGLAEARTALAAYLAPHGDFDPDDLAHSRDRLATAGVGGPESSGETADRFAALARLHGGSSAPDRRDDA